MPPPIHHVMFVSSGSEAVESALKLAIRYHRLRHPAFEGATLSSLRGGAVIMVSVGEA